MRMAKSINILIVDDSSMMRAMISRAVKMSGADVATLFEAANGRDALTLLETESIDAVFTDLNMPVMSGTELLREMVARVPYPVAGGASAAGADKPSTSLGRATEPAAGRGLGVRAAPCQLNLAALSRSGVLTLPSDCPKDRVCGQLTQCDTPQPLKRRGFLRQPAHWRAYAPTELSAPV
jgi:CheY-like chemotaxis protein